MIMALLIAIAYAACSPISVDLGGAPSNYNGSAVTYLNLAESMATSSTSIGASSPPAVHDHPTACCVSTASTTSSQSRTHFDYSAALSDAVLNTRHDGPYRVGAARNAFNSGLAMGTLSVYTGFLIGVSAVALGASVGALLVTL